TLNFFEGEPPTGGGPGTPPMPSTSEVAPARLENAVEADSNPPVPVTPAGDFSVDTLQVKAASEAGTVTFQVSGEGAAFVNGVKVQIFNAGGKRIKTLESGGNSVEWSTSGVPNGVYLYSASVNDGGAYVQTNIDKLLLLK
ncbi:T9SS type A sorting domain-containing protein, partial [Candidatus Bipolaricaulota bacterium]|nr:T9SS type A sorting domain-containing protein [Candidatus Bipolaricaulota bacterium]